MRSVKDAAFGDDVRRWALRHACEDCVFFVDERAACANGYPNAMHRAAAFEPGSQVDGTFCKEFELR